MDFISILETAVQGIGYLVILTPYIIAGVVLSAFAGDDGTIGKLGPFAIVVHIAIIVLWPLMFLILWIFDKDDGPLPTIKRKINNFRWNKFANSYVRSFIATYADVPQKTKRQHKKNKNLRRMRNKSRKNNR